MHCPIVTGPGTWVPRGSSQGPQQLRSLRPAHRRGPAGRADSPHSAELHQSRLFLWVTLSSAPLAALLIPFSHMPLSFSSPNFSTFSPLAPPPLQLQEVTPHASLGTHQETKKEDALCDGSSRCLALNHTWRLVVLEMPRSTLSASTQLSDPIPCHNSCSLSSLSVEKQTLRPICIPRNKSAK